MYVLNLEFSCNNSMILPFLVMNNAQIRQVKILIVSDPIACPPIRYAKLQISM
jgi:hypothetical protein